VRELANAEGLIPAQPTIFRNIIYDRANLLPLLGLALLNRLQRREILHQEPVSEDVTTTDLAQKDALGRIVVAP
jgi:hypothetical protein